MAPPPIRAVPPPASPAVHRLQHVQQGLHPRPKGVVDPYALGRVACDLVGINQFTIWCPHCERSLWMTDCRLTEHDLYVEGICYGCGHFAGREEGVVKRMRIPMRRGELPPVEE